MRHDTWGVVLEDTASSLIPFGFAGGLYDAETGLVRFGARDYDPALGRWISKDPLLFDVPGTNLYVYALGEPINIVDRNGATPAILLGLCAFGGCEAIAATAAAAAAATMAAITCVATGVCQKMADKAAEKVKDICNPRTPLPNVRCTYKGMSNGNMTCNYSCTNGGGSPVDKSTPTLPMPGGGRRCITGAEFADRIGRSGVF